MSSKMLAVLALLVCLLTGVTIIDAQQTIYWKKDHIYAGPGGKEIAVLVPPSSDTTAPNAPSGLTVSVTATSAGLSWTPSNSGDVVGHKIYRQKGSGASLPVGTVGPSASGFTDQPLQPATSYAYAIVAFDAAQNHSTASNSANVTTSAWTGETAKPGIPTNLTGRALSHSSVRLDWLGSTDSGGSGVAGYKVYRDSGSGAVLISGLVVLTAYTDTMVTSHHGYAYTVAAIDNANNESTASSSASVTTPYELWDQDSFSRPNNDTLGWYNQENWWVYSTRARCPDQGEEEDPFYCAAWKNFTAGRFRATVRIAADEGGILFWQNSLGGCFRAYAWSSGTIRLEYHPYQNLLFGATSISSTTFSTSGWDNTITVEADHTTGDIKVYAGSTLKIAYNETNSAKRSGSLWLGLWGSPSQIMDDWFVYKLVN